ncbi:hypothetical protein [Salinisphaera orenii]|uniref:Uncharacterized protein n=1 Tax=Salinisphaera orenii YIM 95161 TaxID=1051139 RepID=A0A423PRT1_9GAMM|nr:hypothetical protein [Salinisphaera halophila]ROO28231.1 hypothetical protein SAHL_10740 [Salinisphaera halophila YIM 95161]
MSTRDNIISLSEVRWKYHGCQHKRLRVDEQLATVECRDCGEKLNPVHVIARMAKEESLWRRRLDALRAVRQKLEKRQRCKCDHCGRMTRIHVR